MRGSWADLSIVDTIYEHEDEDEDEDHSLTSPSLSSSPATTNTLHARVKAWSHTTGWKSDIAVDVEGSTFQLHKDRLTWRSGYFKRQLTDVTSIITLSPPLRITSETFKIVAEFCYGAEPVITPFNVPAVRIAADLLEMNGEDNLVQLTEAYFCRVIAVNQEFAEIVFRSCLTVLPEAETSAFLVSRCVGELSFEDDGDGVMSWFDGVKTVGVDDFQIIVDSMHRRFTRSHDVLYKIVDYYVKENSSKITEDHIDEICSTIDCAKLSTKSLMHAVQNPEMPLKLLVRAMCIQQLHTRRSVLSAATDHHRPVSSNHSRKNSSNNIAQKDSTVTLGAILQRDAALRQMDQMKVAMDATSFRIQSLERELNGMKKKLLLRDSQEKKGGALFLLEPGPGNGRSASFRFSSANKVAREERGSVSSTGLRFSNNAVRVDKERGHRREESCSSESIHDQNSSNSPTVQKKGIGRRLMNGLKSAFRVSKHGSVSSSNKSVSKKVDLVQDWNGDEIFVIQDEDTFPSHTRSRSDSVARLS